MSNNTTQSTSRSASLFLLTAAWIVLSLAAGREASALAPALWEDLVREVATAGLLFAGFYLLAKRWLPDLRPLSSVGFVRRPGIATEFGVGAALGWAVAIALVLPALLTGNLSLTFGFNALALTHLLLSVAVLVSFALVVQLVLAGLPVRLLVRATGPGWAVGAVIFVAVCLGITGAQGQGSSVLVSALTVAMFCTAFLRTRAIWLPLGLQIGWMVSLQLIFGAASPYTPPTYGLVQSDTGGPAWLTGGAFGPEASLFAVVVLIAALIVLYRVTRDYAWHYTYQPIVGAGYAMDVAPPAEHVREEQKAAARMPLVQIGGIAAAAPPPPADPLP